MCLKLYSIQISDIILTNYSDSQQMLLKNVSRLKIIFLTDIHLNHQAIDKLEQWTIQHYNTQPNFDYCLIGGDIANCNYEKNNHDQDEMYNQMSSILQRVKGIFGCKLLFIPGNHDNKDFFKDQRKNDIFINIHNKIVQISDGLHILGFGGSVPAYRVQNYNDPHQQLYWTGYPYFNEGDLRKQWEKGALAKILQGWEKTNPQTQLIMLTHIGPKISPTAVDNKQASPDLISTGSQYLNKMVNIKNALCWFHGHTHEGSKYYKHIDLPIMNPGALKNYEFMYFEVIKDENVWKMSTKVFQTLI